jgi:uncharacterized phage-like protein YoqJ
MIVAATGHRPDKLGGYDSATRRVVEGHAWTILECIQPDGVISGMAQGWDQAMARAAISLGIPVIAALPCAGQEDMWPEAARIEYWRLLAEGLVVSKIKVWEHPGYQTETIAEAMKARNRWMVDNAGHVIALWDGSPGGTGHCVEYARSVGKPVLNGWAGLGPYRESGRWLL